MKIFGIGLGAFLLLSCPLFGQGIDDSLIEMLGVVFVTMLVAGIIYLPALFFNFTIKAMNKWLNLATVLAVLVVAVPHMIASYELRDQKREFSSIVASRDYDTIWNNSDPESDGASLDYHGQLTKIVNERSDRLNEGGYYCLGSWYTDGKSANTGAIYLYLGKKGLNPKS